MGYDSLSSDTEALTKVKLQQVDRLKKQLQAAMKTIGNLDERLTSLESMVHVAYSNNKMILLHLLKKVNELKGNRDMEEAASKFDMDGMSEFGGIGVAAPVG